MNISIPIAATLIFNKSNTALRNFAHYLKPYYGGGGISHLYTREREREEWEFHQILLLENTVSCC